MRTIGISPLDKDSTVSFVENGVVVFACAEERLSRVKLQDGFPSKAMALGFAKTGWSPESVEAVGYGFLEPSSEDKLISRSFAQDGKRYGMRDSSASLKAVKKAAESYQFKSEHAIPGFDSESDEFMPSKDLIRRLVYSSSLSSPQIDWILHRYGLYRWRKAAMEEHRLRLSQLEYGLNSFGLDGRLKRFAHHNTHAANAFYSSGFEDALIVTFDGYGSGQAGGIYRGDSTGIKNLIRFSFPNSLGQFYEHVTSGLGFRPSRHEGKIVGLAAYGNSKILRDAILKRFVPEEGDIVFRSAGNPIFARALGQIFAKRDIAASYQQVLEEVAVRTIAWWIEKTGLCRVALSGGVHANVKLNQRIKDIPGVQAISVYPNMGDGGCGTGAAWLLDSPATGNRSLENVYWGPEFSDREIIQALERHELSFQHPENIEYAIAKLLSEDVIVARFNGRMEYGPRALGNRSVMYAAKDPKINQWLNHQLGRTEFMPFAPSVLAEQAHRLFKGLEAATKAAEFMTITFDCTEEMKRLCPAAVHIDGTARPQLVTETANPSYHRVLSEYYRLTGIPAVINTSFNMHEEPIVCSPDDAIRAFLLGNIHALAIGPYLALHPKHKTKIESL